MPAFTLDPNDARDASNDVSRYGAYLSIHAGRFKVSTHNGDEPTSDPHEFASYAFALGQTPIMSPPYIHSHPLVRRAVTHWDEDGRPAMNVDLAMAQLPSQLGGMVAETWTWHGWETLRNGSLGEPDNNDRNSVFTTVTVRVTYGHLLLPEPLYLDGVPIWSTAVAAVGILVNHLNDTLAPFLNRLNTESRHTR